MEDRIKEKEAIEDRRKIEDISHKLPGPHQGVVQDVLGRERDPRNCRSSRQ